MSNPTLEASRRLANRARANACAHPRVRAKPILPGATYLITRRCVGRQFLLRPEPKLNAALGYWLALCAQRTGVHLHAACVMSNHIHIVLTDPNGTMPEFKNRFFAGLARYVNVLRGRCDSVFSADRACDVRLLDDHDVIDRIAYTLANPVKAALVRRSKHWPGFTTAGWKFGETRHFEKPCLFFDANNSALPDTVELPLQAPKLRSARSARSASSVALNIAHRLQQRERLATAEHAAAGIRILGPKHVLKQSWTATPRSIEPKFGLRPIVSVTSKWVRIAALQTLKTWKAAYALAREAFIAGRRDVPFPAGTYALVKVAGVLVESPQLT